MTLLLPFWSVTLFLISPPFPLSVRTYSSFCLRPRWVDVLLTRVRSLSVDRGFEDCYSHLLVFRGPPVNSSLLAYCVSLADVSLPLLMLARQSNSKPEVSTLSLLSVLAGVSWCFSLVYPFLGEGYSLTIRRFSQINDFLSLVRLINAIFPCLLRLVFHIYSCIVRSIVFASLRGIIFVLVLLLTV